MKRAIFNSLASVTVMSGMLFLASCSKDEPKKEDTPELITKATLVFTPSDGSAAVTVTATDPDNQGARPIAIDGPISLAKNKTYVLTIALINGLAKPTEPAYDVSEEVREEGIEHQFFFAWTKDVFSNPSGNGNVDNRTDPVLYEGGQNNTSKDVNGRNLGLVTTWTTVNSSVSGGTFTVRLKHQPDGLKSDTSDSATGETDLDLTFVLNVQ
ncbi:MAG: hypothetical protein ACKOE6_03915 [Flammeovirgaceae bacterium]